MQYTLVYYNGLNMGEHIDIKTVEEFVQEELVNDCSGHDLKHAQRVANTALKLANQITTCDKDIISISTYIHDIVDEKIVDNVDEAKIRINKKLDQWNISFSKRYKIFEIIEHISFSKNLGEKYTLPIEGQVVQDADRIDAIGTSGIAHAFYYGGHVGNHIHDTNFSILGNSTKDSYREENTVINHFHEKLLVLEKSMNTSIAKDIAKERTAFMSDFLERFYREWDGKK